MIEMIQELMAQKTSIEIQPTEENTFRVTLRNKTGVERREYADLSYESVAYARYPDTYFSDFVRQLNNKLRGE